MLDNLEGGGLDDLDDLLDDFENVGKRVNDRPPVPSYQSTSLQHAAKSTGALQRELGGSAKQTHNQMDQLELSDRQTRGPNPSAGSTVEDLGLSGHNGY